MATTQEVCWCGRPLDENGQCFLHPVGAQANSEVDLRLATELTPEVVAVIEHAFSDLPWSADEIAGHRRVRDAFMEGVKLIIAGAPPSPARSMAILNICKAWLDSDTAIIYCSQPMLEAQWGTAASEADQVEDAAEDVRFILDRVEERNRWRRPAILATIAATSGWLVAIAGWLR